METTRVYYGDTYRTEDTAVVTSVGADDAGCFIVFDRTIFHPQGGGQPSDQGTVTFASTGELPVRALAEDKNSKHGAVKHYVHASGIGGGGGLAELGIRPGEQATLRIDLCKRLAYARLHTAGHLLANVVERLYPGMVGYKGNHFPGDQAFVVFKGTGAPEDKATFISEVEGELRRLVTADGKVEVLHASGDCDADGAGEPQPRAIAIDGFAPCACGGTHVSRLSELGAISIRSVRKQKGELKVGYDVVASDSRS